VHQQSSLLAPLAVDAVLKITEEGKEVSVDLNVRANCCYLTDSVLT